MFVEGKRVYLRLIEKSDIKYPYLNWLNDLGVVRYLESRFCPQTAESISRYIDDNPYLMAICLKDTITGTVGYETNKPHQHICNINLRNINWIHRFAEVGLLIGEKDEWGKGYGSEAISLMANYAFEILGLHKLTAGCYSKNVGAIKAFEKAGFQIEGTLRRHYWFEGRYTDAVILGKVKEAKNCRKN